MDVWKHILVHCATHRKHWSSVPLSRALPRPGQGRQTPCRRGDSLARAPRPDKTRFENQVSGSQRGLCWMLDAVTARVLTQIGVCCGSKERPLFEKLRIHRPSASRIVFPSGQGLQSRSDHRALCSLHIIPSSRGAPISAAGRELLQLNGTEWKSPDRPAVSQSSPHASGTIVAPHSLKRPVQGGTVRPELPARSVSHQRTCAISCWRALASD